MQRSPTRLTQMSLSKQSRISLLNSVSQKAHPKILRPIDVLEDIRDGKWENEITKIRGLAKSDPEKASRLKKELPAVMFSGKFSGSGAKTIQEHSGLVCFDFDKLEGGEINALRCSLKTLPCVYAFFLSPRGNGLKVLIHAKADDAEEHKNCWGIAAEKLQAVCKVEVDPAPKNIASKCFVSFDPDLWVNTKELHCIFPISPTLQPLISGYSECSECSISHKANSQWEQLEEAEKRLDALPKAKRNTWDKYIVNRRVAGGHRYEFLLKLLHHLYGILPPEGIISMLMLHYDLNCGIWSTSRDDHELEIRGLLDDWRGKYIQQLEENERKAYLAIPDTNHQFSFRLCRSLAGESQEFYLSCNQLGERIGIHMNQASRILRKLEATGNIKRKQTGNIWQKGNRPLATQFHYTANGRITC